MTLMAIGHMIGAGEIVFRIVDWLSKRLNFTKVFVLGSQPLLTFAVILTATPLSNHQTAREGSQLAAFAKPFQTEVHRKYCM